MAAINMDIRILTKNSKYKSSLFDYLILISMSLVIGLCTWISRNEVGSGDALYFGETMIRNAIPFPPYWNLGMNGASVAWMAPLMSIAALITTLLHSSLPIQIMVFGFSPIATGALVTYPLARYIVNNRFGALVASLLFGWNTYSLVGLQGGQYLQVGANTFMPIIVFASIRAFDERHSGRWLWIAAAAFGAQAAYDPRFSYITLLGVGVSVIAVSQKLAVPVWKTLAFAVVLIGCMGVAALIVQAPWLAGMLSNPGVSPLPASYSDGSWLKSLSHAHLVNIMSIHHPYFPSQFVWDSSRLPFGEEALVPLGVLVILGGWVGRRDPMVTGMSLAFVGSAILAKGVQPPWEGLFWWVFAHVPGMSMFRDPVKWLSLASLFASLLIGVAAREFGLSLLSSRTLARASRRMAPLVVLVLGVIAPIVPYLVPGMDLRAGLLASVPFTAEDVAFNSEITSRGGPLRVLVVPWGASRIEMSSESEVWALYDLVQGRWAPFVPHSERMIDHYRNLLGSPLFSSLLRIGNFHYVLVPADPDGWVFGRDRKGSGPEVPGFDAMVQIVEETTGLVRRSTFSDRAVFDVPNPMGPMFIVRQLRTGDREDVIRQGVQATMPWGGSATPGNGVLLGIPEDSFGQESNWIQRIGGSRLVGLVNLDSDGWLVLSEEYADGWKAYLVPETEPRPAIVASADAWPAMRSSWWWLWPGSAANLDRWALGGHVKVNGYMQGWRIPQAGSYRLVVEYLPQRGYEAGWLVTIGGLVCATLVVGAAMVRALIRYSVR